jgi:hypothetical protein
MIRAVQPHAAQLLLYYGGTDEPSRVERMRRIPFTTSPSLVLTCIGFFRSMSDGTTKREGERDSQTVKSRLTQRAAVAE